MNEWTKKVYFMYKDFITTSQLDRDTRSVQNIHTSDSSFDSFGSYINKMYLVENVKSFFS